MTCRELIEFLLDYMEGELPAEQRRLFEQHIQICQDCADYIDSYRQTIELSRDAFNSSDKEIPADVPDELVAAILAARGGSGESD